MVETFYRKKPKRRPKFQKQIKHKLGYFIYASRKFKNQLPMYLNHKREYNFRIRHTFYISPSLFKDGLISNFNLPTRLNAFTSYFILKHF